MDNSKPPKPKNSNTTGIELNIFDDDDYFNMQNEDYISIEPNDNSNFDLDYEDRDNFNYDYEGILKSPFKLPKKRTKNKKRRARYVNTTSDYDDLNELLINDDDDETTYNNYSRVPTSYQDSDDETLDDDFDDNMSNNDYYLINQDEIPFVNLWSSFSKIFIRTILRSTKRYNTYEKEVRRNCLISLLGVIATSTVYLIIALYTIFMDGYTMKNIHDINNYTERAMLFSSLILIFTSCLGLIGVRFKFKPMLTMYILMNIISFSFQYYSIKQIHSSVVHTERDMSFAWWDVYTNEVKMNLESQFNCCGYLDYTDNAVPIDICPESIVHKKVKFETIGPIPVTDQKKRFNKTFTIPDVAENYFTQEEMKQVQVKIEKDKPDIPEEKGDAMMDIGININLDDEANVNKGDNYKDTNLKKRKDVLNSVPEGCYKEITKKVSSSLNLLCIFCWILSISSPLALIFSFIYCKSLELKKKPYEYF